MPRREQFGPENIRIPDTAMQEETKEIFPPPPTMHENPEYDPSFLEWAQANPKIVRAGAAILGAVIKTEWQFLNDFPLPTPDFLKTDKERADDKELDKHGFFGTIIKRSKRYYEKLGKVEKTVEAAKRGDWDTVFGEEAKTNE